MLHVQGQIGQADCHLITLPDGRHVLIDAGEGIDAYGAAVAQLQRHSVNHLALAVISHFHADHYGQLLRLLDAGIRIDRVVVNLPADRRIADREMPWGCNYDDVVATLNALSARGVPYAVPRAGERLIESTTAEGVVAGLEVVCAYDGITTPIGETDINDTSIILHLVHGTTRVLFTGDLNHSLGAYLAESGADIRADILKAPHHGTEGCAPNEFYDRVDASAVLVPSPTALWFSRRSSRTRSYFADRGIDTFVNGLHGNVTVSLQSGSYRIATEIRASVSEFALAPRILVPPVSATIGTGSRLTLSATVEGSPRPSMQWTKNGRPIEGATEPTLLISSSSADDGGIYAVTTTNCHGSATSAPATVTITDMVAPRLPSTLINLSGRGWVGHESEPLIAGFVIGGQGSKTLLVRAVGPTLAEFGVADPLPNPSLLLTTVQGERLCQNEAWWAHAGRQIIEAAATRVGAFSLPAGSADAAMIVSLPPGAYTALAVDRTGGEGIALVELYDLDPGSPARLINLSARAQIGPGHTALIAGFVTAGSSDIRLLCRAVGPSLQTFGLTSYLPLPLLTIDDPANSGSATFVTRTDSDGLTAATLACGAFGLLDGTSDIASVISVPQGVRTAIVNSGDATVGTGLLELYVVP